MPALPFQLSRRVTYRHLASADSIVNHGVSAATTQGLRTHYQHTMTRIKSTTSDDRVDHLEMPCDKPGPGVLQVTPKHSRGVRYAGGCTS
jgi:hypothetical protein